MNPVVHVLRRMGGRATTLLPFSLAIWLLFQNLSAAARPLPWPLAVDADIFLFIAAVQFPLYLMPTLLEPLYRRLLPR
jgi:hypothetical protein